MISFQSISADAPLPLSQREAIEWSDLWLSHSTENSKPRVLLIGDSIVSGLYPTIEKHFKDRAFVGRLSTSFFASDPLLLSQVTLLLNHFRFDVIYLNNGMHGWARNEDEYALGMASLVATVRTHAPAAQIIIGNTTPLKEEPAFLNLSKACDSRILRRNEIADALARENCFALCDMYTPLKGRLECYTDNVHFNEDGIAIQGQLLSRHIERALGVTLPCDSLVTPFVH